MTAAVGGAVLGENFVSSTPESVAAIEAALKDLMPTAVGDLRRTGSARNLGTVRAVAGE